MIIAIAFNLQFLSCALFIVINAFSEKIIFTVEIKATQESFIRLSSNFTLSFGELL